MAKETEKRKNKYILCDIAERNWGKTTTLKKVIEVMDTDGFFKLELTKSALGGKKAKEKRAHYTCPSLNKRVVVSTIGDNISIFAFWLKKAADYPADVIVAACHPADRTLCEIFKLADNYGYEIIWFKSIRFDNNVLVKDPPFLFDDIKKAEADGIVEVVKRLLK